jgi:hypothetical protein
VCAFPQVDKDPLRFGNIKDFEIIRVHPCPSVVDSSFLPVGGLS